MIRKLQIQERATEKTLDIEPTSIGVRLFTVNNALQERVHIQLAREDMMALIALFQERITQIDVEEVQP